MLGTLSVVLTDAPAHACVFYIYSVNHSRVSLSSCSRPSLLYGIRVASAYNDVAASLPPNDALISTTSVHTDGVLDSIASSSFVEQQNVFANTGPQATAVSGSSRRRNKGKK